MLLPQIALAPDSAGQILCLANAIPAAVLSPPRGPGQMDSRELTAEQLAKIQEAIAPCRKFLLHLMLRTEEIFKPSDELYIAAHEAQAAMQSLFVTVHYLKCRHGVGKPTPGLVPQQITQGEPMPILVESRFPSVDLKQVRFAPSLIWNATRCSHFSTETPLGTEH